MLKIHYDKDSISKVGTSGIKTMGNWDEAGKFFDTNEFKAARIVCEEISNTRDIDYENSLEEYRCVFSQKARRSD